MNTKLLFWKVPSNLGSYCPPQWDSAHALLLSRELTSEEGYFTVNQLDKLWGQIAKVNASRLAALFGRGWGHSHSCSFVYDPNRNRRKTSGKLQVLFDFLQNPWSLFLQTVILKQKTKTETGKVWDTETSKSSQGDMVTRGSINLGWDPRIE